MSAVAVSESFSIISEELLMGRQEQKFLLAFSQVPQEKASALVNLARELFPELKGLKDFEVGVIALGYIKGQKEFNVRAYFSAAGGQLEAHDRLIYLEEDEGKKKVLREAFEEKKEARRGRRRKNL